MLLKLIFSFFSEKKKKKTPEKQNYLPDPIVHSFSVRSLSSLPGLPAISHPGTIVHTNAGKAQINRLTECL